VSQLEALKMVAVLDLATDNVDGLLNELGTLSVVTLGPVVSGTGLTGDVVVGAEQLAKRAGADSILGTRLKIDQNSTGDVLVVATLRELEFTLKFATPVSNRSWDSPQQSRR
jgi:hypothetical protein